MIKKFIIYFCFICFCMISIKGSSLKDGNQYNLRQKQLLPNVFFSTRVDEYDRICNFLNTNNQIKKKFSFYENSKRLLHKYEKVIFFALPFTFYALLVHMNRTYFESNKLILNMKKKSFMPIELYFLYYIFSPLYHILKEKEGDTRQDFLNRFAAKLNKNVWFKFLINPKSFFQDNEPKVLWSNLDKELVTYLLLILFSKIENSLQQSFIMSLMTLGQFFAAPIIVYFSHKDAILDRQLYHDECVKLYNIFSLPNTTYANIDEKINTANKMIHEFNEFNENYNKEKENMEVFVYSKDEIKRFFNGNFYEQLKDMNYQMKIFLQQEQEKKAEEKNENLQYLKTSIEERDITFYNNQLKTMLKENYFWKNDPQSISFLSNEKEDQLKTIIMFAKETTLEREKINPYHC